MGLPHDEMLSRMSSAEITAWQGYEQVTGPLGPERDDILATLTAYYTVSALGAKKARLDKMLPTWDRPKQDWRQMSHLFEAITVQAGGTVTRN